MEGYYQFNEETGRARGIEYCRTALASISRSFALTIPMVNQELRDKITVGYVVARVLDTLEDSPIPVEMKKVLMDEWIEIISSESLKSKTINPEILRSKLRNIISKSSNYVAGAAYSGLMKNLFAVYAAVTSFDTGYIACQHKWFGEMKEGMKKYLTKRISSFKDLDEYAYYVAGTVGGFLTDLVCEAAESEAQKHVLKSTYKDFGLLLQKVNIIRDFREDVLGQRYFWPKDLFPGFDDADLLKKENLEFALSVLGKIISDAKAHIPGARTYINSIPSKFRGYKMFALVNFYMAVKTLEMMEDNPDVLLSEKPVKIGRANVEAIIKRAEFESSLTTGLSSIQACSR